MIEEKYSDFSWKLAGKVAFLALGARIYLPISIPIFSVFSHFLSIYKMYTCSRAHIIFFFSMLRSIRCCQRAKKHNNSENLFSKAKIERTLKMVCSNGTQRAPATHHPLPFCQWQFLKKFPFLFAPSLYHYYIRLY